MVFRAHMLNSATVQFRLTQNSMEVPSCAVWRTSTPSHSLPLETHCKRRSCSAGAGATPRKPEVTFLSNASWSHV